MDIAKLEVDYSTIAQPWNNILCNHTIQCFLYKHSNATIFADIEDFFWTSLIKSHHRLVISQEIDNTVHDFAIDGCIYCTSAQAVNWIHLQGINCLADDLILLVTTTMKTQMLPTSANINNGQVREVIKIERWIDALRQLIEYISQGSIRRFGGKRV